jgi:hypothetical protein
VCGAGERETAAITPEAIRNNLVDDRTVFDAVAACFDDLSEDGLHIEKVGFARNVVEIVGESSRLAGSEELRKSLEEFEGNMKILFRGLNRIRREAERELISERVTHKINRLKDSFIQDHPTAARREEAHVLFDDMGASLDDGPESDPARLAIMNLRREFSIDDDMTRPIDRYNKFKEGLEHIKYAGRLATQELDPEDKSDDTIDPSAPEGEAKAASSTIAG